MPWTVILWDGPGAPGLRQRHLGAHLAYAESVMDRLLVGGPFRRPDGTFVGSLLVVDAETEDEVRMILEGDPYFQAGVWSDVRIEPFRPVVGTWIGGKVW